LVKKPAVKIIKIICTILRGLVDNPTRDAETTRSKTRFVERAVSAVDKSDFFILLNYQVKFLNDVTQDTDNGAFPYKYHKFIINSNHEKITVPFTNHEMLLCPVKYYKLLSIQIMKKSQFLSQTMKCSFAF
jgi:hypothetical protein